MLEGEEKEHLHYSEDIRLFWRADDVITNARHSQLVKMMTRRWLVA